jgi:hypothetical protein
MLGTDRKYKTYNGAMTSSQDNFRALASARDRSPIRDEASRLSMASIESNNMHGSSIKLGYRDSLIGNQMFND